MSVRLLFADALCLFFAACDQPMAEDGAKVPPKADSTEIADSIDGSPAFSVAEARNLFDAYSGKEVRVAGYVVGCIAGMSFGAACFQPPFTTASNLIISDRMDAAAAGECFPVSLPANSDVRKSLNLKDNGSIWHARIVFQGYMEMYFKQPGMKQVSAYAILSPADSSHTKPVPSDGVHLPVNEAGEVVHGGRMTSGGH